MAAATTAGPTPRVPVVNDELQSLIALPSREDIAALRARIVRDRFYRDPIYVKADDGTLLSSRVAFDLCSELGVEMELVEVELADLNEARDWIARQQLSLPARSKAVGKYHLGRLYLSQTAQGRRTDKEAEDETEGGKTAKRLAAEYSVNERTVRRYASFARAVDKLAEILGDVVRLEILSGELRWSEQDIKDVNLLPEVELRAAYAADVKKRKDKEAKAAQKANAGTSTDAITGFVKGWDTIGAEARRSFVAELVKKDPDFGQFVTEIASSKNIPTEGGDDDNDDASDSPGEKPAAARAGATPAARNATVAKAPAKSTR